MAPAIETFGIDLKSVATVNESIAGKTSKEILAALLSDRWGNFYRNQLSEALAGCEGNPDLALAVLTPLLPEDRPTALLNPDGGEEYFHSELYMLAHSGYPGVMGAILKLFPLEERVELLLKYRVEDQSEEDRRVYNAMYYVAVGNEHAHITGHLFDNRGLQQGAIDMLTAVAESFLTEGMAGMQALEGMFGRIAATDLETHRKLTRLMAAAYPPEPVSTQHQMADAIFRAAIQPRHALSV